MQGRKGQTSSANDVSTQVVKNVGEVALRLLVHVNETDVALACLVYKAAPQLPSRLDLAVTKAIAEGRHVAVPVHVLLRR